MKNIRAPSPPVDDAAGECTGPSMARSGSLSKLTSKASKGMRRFSLSSKNNAGDLAGDGQDWENASVGSKTSSSSVTSRASNAAASMKRGLSSTFKLGRRASTGSTATKGPDTHLGLSDSCETVTTVRVYKAEFLESQPVADLAPGALLEIISVGADDWLKVKIQNSDAQGWIKRVALGEPVVVKRAPGIDKALEAFIVGGNYEVKTKLTVRVEEPITSESKAVLNPGTLVQILIRSADDKRRAKISAQVVNGLGVEGWISLASQEGQVLLGDPSENGNKTAGVEFVPKYLKIKGLLEAAVLGELPKMQKILEDDKGWVSKLRRGDNNRPGLDSCDVRGMTALMYAAAYANRDIVDYLLSKDPELHAATLDNTQKTVLHHACKRAKARKGPNFDKVQEEIITMLVKSGIPMEARDHNGCTALMFAVANGDEPVTRCLLISQADVNVGDYEGRRSLDYALTFGQHRIAELLRSCGAVRNQDTREEEEDDAGVYTAEAADDQPQTRDAGGALAAVAGYQSSSRARQLPDLPAENPDEEAPTLMDAKAPGKKKKKALKKGKKASKRPSVSAGMMECVDMEDDFLAVTVEAAADEDASVVDERELARLNLATLVQASPTLGQLKAAIKNAQSAGVTSDDQELRDAEQSLKALKKVAKIKERLLQAVSERYVPRLQEAIAEAENNGVSADVLEDARQVYAEEKPLHKARERLEAVLSGEEIDKDKLREAVTKARKAGLQDDEVAEAEEFLQSMESLDKATEMLETAMDDRDVVGLKFAIQNGKKIGVDSALIKQAKGILKEEEPRDKARHLIAEACEARTLDALEAALDAAKAANLDPSEYAHADALVKKEKKKIRALDKIGQVMRDVEGVDMQSIDALREAKGLLSAAIQEANKVGVGESELFGPETHRKKLHNAIEDLKGSIRVFCRVRPLSSKETDHGDSEVTKAVGSMTVEVESSGAFNFDAVFTPGSQLSVFEDCKDLVQSAVDGYNVTIFAYGQTGAGKTFTMYGAPGNEGIAPRTIDEIFRVIDTRKSRFSYTVFASMLELYQNSLVDLLRKGDPNASKIKPSVKVDKSGVVSLENILEEECRDPTGLSALLERGNNQRTVAATAMNSESSRSHLMLLIRIVSVNKDTKEQVVGKVLLCDLAGSERLKKSQVHEEQQKEAIEINKSLTALGDVMEALTKGLKLIPYRNHKLTQLMQDALGGTAKTLMFVNCSPANSNFDETVTSLKYATRAKKITNTAKKG